MIEAAERMQQPFGEAHLRMVADMRQRRGAETRRRDSDECGKRSVSE
jgi:hypothetical protein